MTQMFCTLKQAADRLETTEAEIEMMLSKGVLREFRDGSRRLLKLADLTDGAVAAPPAVNVRDRHEAGSPQAQIDKEAFTLPEPEIRLPPTATVTARVSPPGAGVSQRAPHPAAGPAGQRRVPRAAATRKPAAQRRRNPPRAVVVSPPSASPQPRPQAYEMSLRRWLWTGLVDDSPLAIFIIFGLILLGTVAIAGTVYLLMQAVWS